MSKVKDLSYDIQELFIEGYGPISIAAQLNCPLELVYSTLETFGVQGEDMDEDRGEYFGA